MNQRFLNAYLFWGFDSFSSSPVAPMRWCDCSHALAKMMMLLWPFHQCLFSRPLGQLILRVLLWTEEAVSLMQQMWKQQHRGEKCFIQLHSFSAGSFWRLSLGPMICPYLPSKVAPFTDLPICSEIRKVLKNVAQMSSGVSPSVTGDANYTTVNVVPLTARVQVTHYQSTSCIVRA